MKQSKIYSRKDVSAGYLGGCGRKFLKALFFFSFVFCASMHIGAWSQEVSFNINGIDYYIHRINTFELQQDMDAILRDGIYVHSMVEKNGRIYIAKNIQPNVVSVYDVINGRQLDDLELSGTPSGTVYSGKFYLTKDSNENLVAFYEPEETKDSHVRFALQWFDENGIVGPVREYSCYINTYYPIINVSSPVITGDYAADEFDIAVSVCKYYNIQNYTTTEYELDAYRFNVSAGKISLKMYSDLFIDSYGNPFLSAGDYGGYRNMVGTLTKVTDNHLYVLDDNCRRPVFVNLETGKYHGSFDERLTDCYSNGFHSFEFEGNTFFLYGKECSATDMTFQLSRFAGRLEELNEAVSLNNVMELAEITAGADMSLSRATKASASTNGYWGYNGSKDIDVVPYHLAQSRSYDNGGGIVLFNCYVPGQTLTTYQINKSAVTTDIETHRAEAPESRPVLEGRTVIFPGSQARIEIYDVSGRRVVEYAGSDRADLTGLSAGVYLVRTDKTNHKLLLK